MNTKTCINFLALCCALLTATVHAQAFPSRPMRVLVPLAAGGGMDSVSRNIAASLTDALGQSVVVDNRPGAGSLVSMEILAESAADGHTLMMISATTVIYPLLYKSRLDPVRDFAPVSQVTAQGYVLVVHPSLPAKSALEFVSYGKSESGQADLCLVRHRQPDPHDHRTDADRYRHQTGPRTVQGHGRRLCRPRWRAHQFFIRHHHFCAGPHQEQPPAALAVSTGKRAPAMPDTPTMAEAGVPGVVVVNWYGLIAPKATPKAVIDKISAETTKAVKAPTMMKHLIADGSEGVGSTAAEFTAHIKAESEQWRRVIKQGGIKAQ